MELSLRITEIFHSLQGESSRTGLPTVFVRLTGCPLRCQYCDTAYAFSGGTRFSIDDIMDKIAVYQCKYVCLTGGEPLAQPNALLLLNRLCDEGYQVSLETSGALDIQQVDPRVMIVLDVKTPDSKESSKNLWENLSHIKSTDEIKFVICSREDYEWSKGILNDYHLTEKATVLFSPSHQQVEPTTLANWIINDKLAVRFQMQLHKILWQDLPGH